MKFKILLLLLAVTLFSAGGCKKQVRRPRPSTNCQRSFGEKIQHDRNCYHHRKSKSL